MRPGGNFAAVRCKHCPALIWWAVTDLGHPMPIDPEPHPNGNVVVVEARRDGTVVVHVLTKAESHTDVRQRLLPHKATCGGRPRPPIVPPGPPPPEQRELDLFHEGE